MSGIKEPIVDVLTQLAAIQVTNMEGSTVGLYSRIWNNQTSDIKGGDTYLFPRPAAFVEVLSSPTFDIIGLGYRSADLGFRIHIVHDYVNQDGTFEQDLEIFDLRDKVIVALSQYTPTACGPLNCVAEEQEYGHGNLYEYTADFVCNFTDSKGSPFDPANGKMEEITNEELTTTNDVTYRDSTPPISTDDDYVIPPQVTVESNDYIIPTKQ